MATKEINLKFNTVEAKFYAQEVLASAKYTAPNSAVAYAGLNVLPNPISEVLITASQLVASRIPGLYTRVTDKTSILDFINTQSGFGISITSSGVVIVTTQKQIEAVQFSNNSTNTVINFDTSNVLYSTLITQSLPSKSTSTFLNSSVAGLNSVISKNSGVPFDSFASILSAIASFDRERELLSNIFPYTQITFNNSTIYTSQILSDSVINFTNLITLSTDLVNVISSINKNSNTLLNTSVLSSVSTTNLTPNFGYLSNVVSLSQNNLLIGVVNTDAATSVSTLFASVEYFSSFTSGISTLEDIFAVKHDYFDDPTYTLDLTYVGSVFYL